MPELDSGSGNLSLEQMMDMKAAADEVADAKRTLIAVMEQELEAARKELESKKKLYDAGAETAAGLKAAADEVEKWRRALERTDQQIGKYTKSTEEAAGGTEKLAGSVQKSNMELAASIGVLEAVTRKAQGLMEGAMEASRYQAEYQLQLKNTARELASLGRSYGENVKQLESMKNALNLTREQMAGFIGTIRSGAAQGFGIKEIKGLTKALQELHGHQRGLDLAKDYAPRLGKMGAMGRDFTKRAGTMSGSEFVDTMSYMSTEDLQMAGDVRRSKSGLGADEDSKYLNDMAKMREGVDKLKEYAAESAQRFMGPLVAVQLPALIMGVGTVVTLGVQTNMLLTQLVSLQVMQGATGGLGGVGGKAAIGGKGAGGLRGKVSGRVMKGAGIGALLAVATDIGAGMAEEHFKESGNKKGEKVAKGVGTVARIGGMALTGAAIGSMGGPVGTALGAVAGGALGLGMEFDNVIEMFKSGKKTADEIRQEERAASMENMALEKERIRHLAAQTKSVVDNFKQYSLQGLQAQKAAVREKVASIGGGPEAFFEGRGKQRGVQEQAVAVAAKQAELSAQKRNLAKYKDVDAEGKTAAQRLQDEKIAEKRAIFERDSKEWRDRAAPRGSEADLAGRRKYIESGKAYMHERDKGSDYSAKRKLAEEAVAAAELEVEKEQQKLVEMRDLSKLAQDAQSYLDKRMQGMKMEVASMEAIISSYGLIYGTSEEIVKIQKKYSDNIQKEVEEVSGIRKGILAAFNENEQYIQGNTTLGDTERAQEIEENNLQRKEALAGLELRLAERVAEMMDRAKQMMMRAAMGFKEGATQVLGEAAMGYYGAQEKGMEQMGMTPGQGRGILGKQAAVARKMADEAQRTQASNIASAAAIRDTAKVDAESFYAEDVETGMAGGMSKADAEKGAAAKLATRKRAADVAFSVAQTSRLTETEKALINAREAEMNVITKVRETIAKRINTESTILETQKGVAEFVGASFGTIFEYQKDIVALKAQELENTRAEIKETEQLLQQQGLERGEQLQFQGKLQGLRIQEAQQQADVIKQTFGMQRSWIDQMLSSAFGTPSGSTFAPAINQRGLFGEHMIGPQGLRHRGHMGQNAQRDALQQAGGVAPPQGAARIGPGGFMMGAQPPANDAAAVNVGGDVRIVVELNDDVLAAKVNNNITVAVAKGTVMPGSTGVA